MICKNHERQPSFLGLAVEKLVKNLENSAQTLRGQSLPLKKVHCFSFGTLCNGRDNQVVIAPLLLMTP